MNNLENENISIDDLKPTINKEESSDTNDDNENTNDNDSNDDANGDSST